MQNKNRLDMKWINNTLHEECGVFGAYDVMGENVTETIYYGLLALQHRGKASCGISVSNSALPKKVSVHKGLGMVNEVFEDKDIAKLKGNLGVGHVRHVPESDENKLADALPLVVNYAKGSLMVAHNGFLLNAKHLRDELEFSGAIFHTSTDAEALAYLIAKERINSRNIEEAIAKIMDKLMGACSLVIASPTKLIGVRDPHGFRPLCIGRKNNTFIFASETCALDTIGAEFIRDVLPGEIVTIDGHGINSDTTMCRTNEEQARCIFEYTYFSRPDSNFDGVNIYNSRVQAGKFLAIDSPVEADVVMGVPYSGNIAALGYSKESGIPIGTAFVRNHAVENNFVHFQDEDVDTAVRLKLNVIKEAVKGRRIILIDDSIIRGLTADRVIGILKEAGATEVHVRIAAPPFRHKCYYGVDIPNEEELMAYNRTTEEICQLIGADSLAYLNEERLVEIAGGNNVCKGCVLGKYPLEPPAYLQ